MSSSNPSRCCYPYLAMSPTTTTHTTTPTRPSIKRQLDEDVNNTSPDAMILEDHGHDVPRGRNVSPPQRGRSRTQRAAESANRTPHRSSNLALVSNTESLPASPSTPAQAGHEAETGVGITQDLPLIPLRMQVKEVGAFQRQEEEIFAALEALKTDQNAEAEAKAQAEAVERNCALRKRIIEWLAKVEELDTKGPAARPEGLATPEILAEDEEERPRGRQRERGQDRQARRRHGRGRERNRRGEMRRQGRGCMKRWKF